MKRRRIAAFFFCAFWHTGSSVVVISEEKTFLASIGKEYPFPYFRPPVLRCVGLKLLVGKYGGD